MPDDQHGDPFEDRLTTALRQAGDAFDIPGAALAAAGETRGRRLRTRRRAALAGSVASLALVGVGGALLVPGDGTSASPTSSVAADGSAEPAVFSAGEVIDTLRKLLPKGTFRSVAGRGTNESLPPLAVAVFDDGKGPGAISLSLDRIRPRSDAKGKGVDPAKEVMPCPDDKAQAGLDSCTTERLPDGSAVTVYQGYEYPDHRAETKSWGADLVTPAGQHVSVIEWNSPAEKGEPVTRPEPPLTTAQLKTLAAAKEWRRVIDAVPVEKKPGASASVSPAAPPGVPGTVILRKLSLLLPKGLERVSHGSQETEYGYFVVDDGKGESLVEINVQTNMLDVADQLYGSDAETLPDGTRVAMRQGPGEKGGEGVVMWTVDTMRKDGRRVVVSAFNSGAQNTAATRAKPAVTMRQLREIALSPQWLSDATTP
jgi:hypothetical protein